MRGVGKSGHFFSYFNNYFHICIYFTFVFIGNLNITIMNSCYISM